jgi:non-lysosomal glucosylceramidase
MSTPTESSSCNSNSCGCQSSLNRRDFLRWTSLAAAGTAVVQWPSIAGPFTALDFQRLIPADKKLDPAWVKSLFERGEPTIYRGAELEKTGMPIGGICAGQLYLGGDGRLWHWDIFNLPQPSNFTNGGGPNYAHPPPPASPIEQGFALKLFSEGKSQIRTLDSRGFDPQHIAFRGQYPMAFVDYGDPALPVTVSLEAFSPFIPLNGADSSLPATMMRFTVTNTSSSAVEVELAGWIENAVCLGSGRAGLGQRRNQVVREDGLTLVHCTAEELPAKERPVPRAEIVFENFENGYGSWQVGGEAFGTEPATGTLPSQQTVSGFLGTGLVNTFLKGDATKGRLTSPEFPIERQFIAFLIGGGSQAGRTCLNLLLDGRVVRTATGRDAEQLAWQEWDVNEFAGRTARLEIVDDSTGAWGHINVDQIVFTDEPPSARTPLTAQEDFGSLGLAVLDGNANTFAHAHLEAELVSALFADAAVATQPDGVKPFGAKLIGGVGRKLRLAPGAQGEATFVVAWFFPGLMRGTLGPLQDIEQLKRSYAKRFQSAAEVASYVARKFVRLSSQTRLWHQTWYDSTLPYWFLDRTFAPICTLATSTCYQFDNGRFYAFEGVYCCQGTCQHVWNYAQSVARIFPDLERDLRERTDFGTAWHEEGATDYRGECARHVAHDGQCGVILRAWREHQMSPDDRYLRATWPRIRKSIEYMIVLDGDDNGLLEGEQYNTLDAAWFGPMAWISSFYVVALRAGEAMALEVGDSAFAERCRRIAERGSEQLVEQLYNGEYFIHKPDPNHPKATNTNDGCHIDQLMGQAWALQVGLPRVVAAKETRLALEAIWKYNFTPDVGPYRDRSAIKGGRWYAMAGEGGVIMTTFPHGGVEQATGQGGFAYYFNEVWTGQEHQLAAHMLWEGMVEQALVIPVSCMIAIMRPAGIPTTRSNVRITTHARCRVMGVSWPPAATNTMGRTDTWDSRPASPRRCSSHRSRRRKAGVAFVSRAPEPTKPKRLRCVTVAFH